MGRGFLTWCLPLLAALLLGTAPAQAEDVDAKAYRQALALTRNAAERRFLERRLGDALA